MAVTVTATVEASNLPPRVKLDVLSTGTSITQVTVGRLDPDGRQVPVRTGDGGPLQLALSGGNYVGTIYDYEMPYGQTIQYGTNEGGLTSGFVIVPETRMWLVPPGSPDLSMKINLRAGSLDPLEDDVTEGVFYVLGRANPVVITDGARKGDSSLLIIGTTTAAEYASLKSLLTSAAVLRLQVPPGLGLHDLPTCYIAVGKTQRRIPSGIASDPRRDVALSFRVVDRPAGGSQAERTWADVLAENATWDTVLAKYPTWVGTGSLLTP